MNYRETLDYLFTRLPMYQRQGSIAYKKDLGNIEVLCHALNNPHHQFKSVHIAGTNGKGSVSHMLASILQESGLKVGLYTSPHLMDFRERIRVNGRMIKEADVIQFVADNQQHIEQIEPSFFEITVAMAFFYFARERVDIAVVETGLGGRLDSTNILNPILSVITNIGWDHSDMLGDTLGKIAREKAGIIKECIPVVIGEHGNETFPVFEEVAHTRNSRLIKAWESGDDLPKCELTGNYQKANIRTVVTAIELLSKHFPEVTEEAIHMGLTRVSQNTGLMGRWQKIQNSPTVICDTGHNIDGIRHIVQQLSEIPLKKLRIVFGQVTGKDSEQVLRLLPPNARYYFCSPSVPRKLDVHVLMEKADAVGLDGKAYNSVVHAYQEALVDANEDDLIFVGGSTFVVADLLTHLEMVDPVG